MMKEPMSAVDAHKELVRRLVDEVVNDGNPDALEELTEGEFTEAAKIWIGPFREAFPDFRMEIVTLVADDERSGRPLQVLGHPSRRVARQ